MPIGGRCVEQECSFLLLELLQFVVLPRCTVTNYYLLEGLAIELSVPEICNEFEESKEFLQANR